MNPQEIFKAHGFPYPDNIIMAFIGGSTQHGARAGDSSDTDWYGIFIPPKEKTLGIDHFEHFVFPGDTTDRERGHRKEFELDIALHSLQKWAGMAAKGNPTVLAFLFAINHDQPPIRDGFWPWASVLNQKDIFLCKKHLWPFIHYGNEQLRRLMGLQGQKNVHRPILEQMYGYDTKYAMHIVRLMVEAKELMETGRISYPNLRVDLLKDIRTGKYKLNEIVQMANDIQAEAIAAQEKSALPESVDRAAISKLIADIHIEFYRSHP